jgi:hypothetical protein
MHAIRSQARKHSLLERQRRCAASQGSYKDGHQSLQVASDRTHVHPLMLVSDATGCPPHTSQVCSEGAGSPNQEVDRQNSGQMAYLLVETQDVQAKYPPVRRASLEKVYEASRKHALQRQALQRMGPQTDLGSGRADPFESSPINGQPYVHILIDHCKSLRFVLLWLASF